jgi:uncharacterized protein
MAQSKPGPIKKSSSKCPICSARAEHEFRPFCSRRCADVDLSRWLRGAYAIPVGGDDADEDGEEAQAARPALPSPKEHGDEDA